MSTCRARPAAGPAPGFAKRIGELIETTGGVSFQGLESASLMNRLKGDHFPFGWTVNPFRGCEFACRYCFARPTHEYLGHADPSDFERRIYVKSTDWSELTRALRRARDSGQEIALGTATDPYQPAERRFPVTRRVLQSMLAVPGLRVGLTTKSTLVARDVGLLGALARSADLWVNVSICSVDADLVRVLEPRSPRPDRRLKAMAALSAAGIPTRLFAMPVLPLLTDGEAGLRELLAAAREAGAREVISGPLFLRGSTRAFFLDFVGREFPWALRRYRELYPGPGSVRADYADDLERRIRRLARETGLPARTRDERVRDEAPARSGQMSLVW